MLRSMGWIEVSVSDVDGEVAEALSEVLGPLVEHRVVLETRPAERALAPPAGRPDPPAPHSRYRVRLYLEAGLDAPALLQRMQVSAGHLRMIRTFPELQVRELEDQDWQSSWRSQHGRLKPGQRLVILPEWDDGELAADEIGVRIEPGMAFGVGSHPSTQLCLRLLEQHVRPGQRLADVGCGSGILSVAALKLGAHDVQSVDLDPLAIRATQRSAEQNGVAGQLQADQGSVEQLRGSFDVVVINIVAAVIARLLPATLPCWSRQGPLLLGGILKESENLVHEALDSLGLEVGQHLAHEDWRAFVVSGRQA